MRVRPARRRDLGIARSRTTATKRLTRDALLRGWLEIGLTPESAEKLRANRPRTRAECADVPRPCPYVGCRWSLYLDVNPETGSIKLNSPTLEPWEMPPDASCALDVAERGGITLESVGNLINLTRERVRQVEADGLRAIRAALVADGLDASDVAFPHVEHPSDDLSEARKIARRRARRESPHEQDAEEE